jgi:hypothetical protein
MKMEWTKDHQGSVIFRGEVSATDIASICLRLDPIDTRLLKEGADNAADMLLILEMLFRRSAEQRGLE